MVHQIIPKPSYLDKCIYWKMIGERKVWRSADKKRCYTWDTLHGEIEVFSKRGIHMGSIHAVTGKGLKLPVKGRVLDV